jgi:hypothetical protein
MVVRGRDILGLRGVASLQVLVIILDRLVCLGVFVSRQDERCPLALEDLFGSSDGWVDETSDLESGTKLVLESERVAGCQYSTDHD